MGIVRVYRFENWLYTHHLRPLAYMVKMIVRVLFSAVIPPSATIGEGTFITYHGLGVVMHKDTVIGRNCCIRQNVTIAGGRGGVPVIGSNVEIGAGAVLIGNIHIGDYVRIGANAVVIENIPDNCTAVGVPAKPVKFYEQGKNTFHV